VGLKQNKRKDGRWRYGGNDRDRAGEEWRAGGERGTASGNVKTKRALSGEGTQQAAVAAPPSREKRRSISAATAKNSNIGKQRHAPIKPVNVSSSGIA